MKWGRWIVVALIAVFAAGTIYWATNRSVTAGYSTISAADLQAKMDAGEKLVIVDLREPDLYQAGHIAGAKNIPFEQFNDRMKELNSSDEIVLVCHTGPMGDVAGNLLAQRGYAKVWNLAGGMARWGGKLVR